MRIDAGRRRWSYRIALAVLAVTLVVSLSGLIGLGGAALSFPFDLDYGEGIVWQQMRNMLAGSGYAPLRVYPAIVYHYPPLFHMTCALLAGATGMDQLAAGRLVSLIATLLSAILIGLLSGRAGATADEPARVRWTGGVLAGLLWLSCYPVVCWAALMRVDMLACAFGLGGLAMAVLSLRRAGWVYGAALLFAAAVFTKQTAVAAPIATFAVLSLVRPGIAVRGLACAILSGLVALFLLQWMTDGGFLRHIILYNINRFTVAHVDGIVGMLLRHLALILLAVAGGRGLLKLIGRGTGIRRRIGADPGLATAAMLIAYALVTGLTSLTILKSGSNVNYFIEFFCAMAVLAGVGIRPVVAAAFAMRPARPVSPVLTAIIAIAIPFQVLSLQAWSEDRAAMARITRRYALVVRRIAASDKPVIADPMAMLIRAGQPVTYESSITAELGHRGVYDERGFVRMVRAHRFGFFVTEGDRGDPLFDSRYNPATAAAMAAAYPVREHVGGLVLHLPAPD